MGEGWTVMAERRRGMKEARTREETYRTIWGRGARVSAWGCVLCMAGLTCSLIYTSHLAVPPV